MEIKEISQSPLIRFFTKDEKIKFFKLIKEYRCIYFYNENSINATAIVSDIEYRLKKSGINPKNQIIELSDGNYEHIYPEEINDLCADIEKIFEKHYWEIETDDCSEQIFILVNRFTKNVYNKKIIDLYKDFNITSIIENAEITKKWNQKFDRYYAAKQEFEELKIVTNAKKSFKL